MSLRVSEERYKNNRTGEQSMLKQVILVRQDLKLQKGKLSVQVAHASTAALLKSDKDDVKEWQQEGMKKIVLKVKDLDELLRYKQLLDDGLVVTALITDAGLTAIPPGTTTCLGAGPDDEDKIDMVTGSLRMV